MVHITTTGTVNVSRSPERVEIEEVFEPSLTGRIFGGLGAICFMAACLFFWQMPVENDGTTTLIIRIALCGGMCAIGIALGRSALIPRDTVTRLEFDLIAREMSVLEVNQDGKRTVKHVIGFSDIKRLYAGSEASHSPQHGGSTVLYMEGEGGPRNGVLMVGSVAELEGFVREANGLLTQSVMARPVDTRPAHSAGGFGRKGAA